MKLLLDTHILLWFFAAPDKLSAVGRALVEDESNELLFSPISFFEVAVKRMKSSVFDVDAHRLHRAAIDRGFVELSLSSRDTLQILQLPQIHKDPFDRLLLAQAMAADAFLLTVDRALLRYPSHVMDAR